MSAPKFHEYGPEVVPSNEKYYTTFPEALGPARWGITGSTQEEGSEGGRQDSKTICGLRRVTFWLTMALAGTIIITALVGGIVGALSASRKNEVQASSPSPAKTSSSSSVPITPASSSSSVPITSTSISSTATPTSSNTPTTVPSPGIYSIRSVATGKAVDLLYGSPDANTPIVSWTPSPSGADLASNKHQLWQISNVGNSTYIVTNTGTGSFLSAPRNLTAGQNPSIDLNASVRGGPGSTEDIYNRWVISLQGDGSFFFINQAYISKQLDLRAGGTDDGTQILLWESTKSSNQRWRLVAG
ncbi:ricin B lectin domain-containing protein [Halenospora varia]|nr:ricin B lectin domain-containing protein [Halenospora varia]